MDYTSFFKGQSGEQEVEDILKQLKLKYIPNMYINTSRGTNQLDFVIVHEKGIYVVEVKNIGGTVSGKLSDKYWSNFNSGRKFQLYNPLIQNMSHIRNLRKIIKYQGFIQNLVVFPDDTAINIVGDKEIMVGSIKSFSELYMYFDFVKPHNEMKKFEVVDMHTKLVELKRTNEKLQSLHDRLNAYRMTQ